MKPAGIARVGRYEILGEIGRGAMATVLRAYDPESQREVALKILRKDAAGADDDLAIQLARFKREGQAVIGLSHPNVVGVYDYGEDDKHVFIAMELVEGRCLKDIIDAREPLARDAVLRIMDALLRALDFAHRAGIVHRDVKPANILIADNGTIKLADFGVAKVESSTLTVFGSVIGTLSYMSPEQLRGEPSDLRSDLFSAGVVLYEMLTGQRPFLGTVKTIELQVLGVDPHRPSLISPNCSTALDHVIERALAKQPAQRYQTAAEFAAALDRAAADDDDADITRRFDSPGEPDGTETVMLASRGTPLTADMETGCRRMEPTVRVCAAEPVRASSGRRRIGRTGPIAAALVTGIAMAGLGWWLLAPSAPEPLAPEPSPGREAPPALVAPQTVAAPPPPSLTPPPAPLPPSSPPLAPSLPSPPPQAPPLLAPPLPPSPPSPPDAATLEATVRAVEIALKEIDCSLLSAAVDRDGRLAVSGAANANTAAVAAAVSRAAPGVPVSLSVWPLASYLCQPLSAVADLADLNDHSTKRLSLKPLRGSGDFVEGEDLVLTVEGPSSLPHLRVDYFTLDGHVLHLIPNPLEPDGRLPASGRLVIGDRTGHGRFWVVGEPFGSEVVIAVGSVAPLFAKPRPEVEPTAKYLADLKTALSRGGRALAVPLLIHSDRR